MSWAQDVRAAQEQLELEMEEDMAQRPPEPEFTSTTPPRVPIGPDNCPGSRHGDGHEFTMKGRDGQRRCWYCVKTRAEVYGS